MEDTKLNAITLYERKILFTNFRGEASEYNAEGNRNFSVLIEDLDEAEALLADGWNLKPLKDEDGEVSAYHLSIAIKYRTRNGIVVRYPPRVFKLREKPLRPVPLDEGTIEMLDYVRVIDVDITINPSHYSFQGRTGVKAYCSEMYVAVAKSELEEKYADYDADELPFDPDEE